jgi:hypothetical protein
MRKKSNVGTFFVTSCVSVHLSGLHVARQPTIFDKAYAVYAARSRHLCVTALIDDRANACWCGNYYCRVSPRHYGCCMKVNEESKNLCITCERRRWLVSLDTFLTCVSPPPKKKNSGNNLFQWTNTKMSQWLKLTVFNESTMVDSWEHIWPS